ncbi:MAG: LysM peptidoglycan-binding domain-containing protein [Eubacterium sp.]|nr:LysM peptidoglycan-binding domain-containing protein [Eubacterium sp.]MBR1761907.1 LysM peptidoglycan-binding domain-containing protein [Eubacterium sp.]
MGRKAKVISFESFFPMGEFRGSIPWKDSHYPITFINALEKCVDRKLTVRFTFSRAGKYELAISLLCTIEKFDYHEDGEDPNTIHYSITLKEYRSPAINQITKKTSSSSASSLAKAVKKAVSKRAKTSTKPKTYTIKKGDTLWAIAKKYLGSGNKWKTIYNANKSVIEKAAKKHGKSSSSTGHWIYPGTVISIPK